jgi:hypothetical protein
MPSFLVGTFAVAGAVAALGPVLIHLLNRRRFRTSPWAAMDLLREAALRTRRLLQWRDVVLMALRTACVLLFGFALARPYFSQSGRAIDPRQPVHAVLIVDNSLSMAYGELGGTLLDQARARAAEFLDRLPGGSRMSIVPLCGSLEPIDPEPFRSVADARDALARITVMDKTATIIDAVSLAREACDRAPHLAAKRIVFLGDQQQIVWPESGLESSLAQLPELQVAAIQSPEVENAWIDDLRIQDGVADSQTPAVLSATIGYDGPAPRRNVEVTLTVAGTPVASQVVDLTPGQTRTVRFLHQFAPRDEQDAQLFVPAVVSLAPDRLPADDTRFVAVPVVAGMPVVFVDQYGAAGEDARRNRYGETFPLRRLLVPAAGASAPQRQLIGVRHVTIDQLNTQLLQDTRLVVIAGVETPGSAVPLLREYVTQGGQLLIAAGGRFSPAAWTQAAWLGGAGILPAPLDAEFVGKLPDQSATSLDPFLLAPTTMDAEFFDIEGASREELDDLYRTPVFFRAVAARVNTSPAAPTSSTSPPAAAGGSAPPIPDSSKAIPSPTDTPPKPSRWLKWLLDTVPLQHELPNIAAEIQPPRVLAAFSNQLPFLIERRIGAGTVLLATSGVGSNWNNLARTNAVLLYDRVMRQMLSRTLPRRNFETFEQPTFPVRSEDRRAAFRLERPHGAPDVLSVDALGPDEFGIALRHLDRRGKYRLVAERWAAEPGSESRPLSEASFAVNGPARESQLATIDETAFHKRVGAAPIRWIGPEESIAVEGADVRGQNLWNWLLWATMGALIAEMVCVVMTRPRPTRRTSDAIPVSTTAEPQHAQ